MGGMTARPCFAGHTLSVVGSAQRGEPDLEKASDERQPIGTRTRCPGLRNVATDLGG